MTKAKTAIFFTDAHYPYHHLPSFSILLQIGKEIGVDFLINGGDAVDAHGISAYTKKTLERGVYEVGKELDGFKKHIHDPLIKALKPERSLWCGGNHDMQRITDVMSDLEEKGMEQGLIDHYAEVMSIPNRFKGTETCEYNDYFIIGKLLFTHGTYHSKNHASQMAVAYGMNSMYGHLHANQVFSHKTVEREQPREATAVGAMCNLKMPYMKKRPSPWSNSFAVVTFLPSGQYAKEIINVINGKAIFRGKVYHGEHKELSQLVK